MAVSGSEQLILKRASASRPTGHWSDDDYDVLAEGAVVGRILKSRVAPVGSPWFWTLAYGYHRDRTPMDGYAATREEAMAAFAKSWPTGIAGAAAAQLEHRRQSARFRAIQLSVQQSV